MLWLGLLQYFCCSCGCLQQRLIISGMLVQVRTVPKHRSTHIPNYQSTERESYERDENQLDDIPMCPQGRFTSYKSLSRLVLCCKKYWATLMHFIYFCYLLIVTNYLITKLSVTYYFSACREYLAENRLSFPSSPRWVRHSYLSKGLRQIPYTCGSSTHSPPIVAMHLLDRSCVSVGIFLKLHDTFPNSGIRGRSMRR